MLLKKLAQYFSVKTLLKIYRLSNDIYYKDIAEEKLSLKLINLKDNFFIYYNKYYFILDNSKLEISDRYNNNIKADIVDSKVLLTDYKVTNILDYIKMIDIFKSILEEYYLEELFIENTKRYSRIGFAHENMVCKDIVTSQN